MGFSIKLGYNDENRFSVQYLNSPKFMFELQKVIKGELTIVIFLQLQT